MFLYCYCACVQVVIMEQWAVRAVRVSSSAASGRIWCTRAAGLENVSSTNTIGTGVSTADCSAAWPSAWNKTVSPIQIHDWWLKSCGLLRRGVLSLDLWFSPAEIPPTAVQCERKPVEVLREKPANCAPSIEKIYIRKNLCSPLAAMPTFVSEKETARYGCECVFESNRISFCLFLTLTLCLITGPPVYWTQTCSWTSSSLFPNLTTPF